MAFLAPFMAPIIGLFTPAAQAAATYVSVTKASAALITAVTPTVVTIVSRVGQIGITYLTAKTLESGCAANSELFEKYCKSMWDDVGCFGIRSTQAISCAGSSLAYSAVCYEFFVSFFQKNEKSS